MPIDFSGIYRGRGLSISHVNGREQITNIEADLVIEKIDHRNYRYTQHSSVNISPFRIHVVGVGQLDIDGKGLVVAAKEDVSPIINTFRVYPAGKSNKRLRIQHIFGEAANYGVATFKFKRIDLKLK